MYTLNCSGKLLTLDTPRVMGILNVTPDSFFDGGKYIITDVALKQVETMLEEGADIIDVGGMSSRPGAEVIDAEKESKRVMPIISGIKRRFPEAIVSIDTVYGATARRAIDEGASIINDISAGELDKEIWKVALENDVPYILMHMQGRPETMQNKPEYRDVSLDVLGYLRDKVFELQRMGIKDIVVDPGFGFGKTIAQNFDLLVGLKSLRMLGCPLMVGLSRKSMLYKSLNIGAEEALNATTAVHMEALRNGANILRVHDVKEAVECIKIHALLNR